MSDGDIDSRQVDDNNANGATIPTREPARSDGREKWSEPLWDEGWNSVTTCFGDVDLMVAAKEWADGTVDVLVAHDPFAKGSMPTAHAHRHSDTGATPMSTYGLANLVAGTVIDVWVRPEDGGPVGSGG
jgi:hypothetical protein